MVVVVQKGSCGVETSPTWQRRLTSFGLVICVVRRPGYLVAGGGERRVVVVVKKGSGVVETSPTTLNVVWARYMRSSRRPGPVHIVI